MGRVVIFGILSIGQVIQYAHGAHNFCSKIYGQTHTRSVIITVADESKLTRVSFVDTNSERSVLLVDWFLHVHGVNVFGAPTSKSFTQGTLQSTIDIGIKDFRAGRNRFTAGGCVVGCRVYGRMANLLAMLQKSPGVWKSPGAIVAPLVKTNLASITFLLDAGVLLELNRRDIVNDLKDLDGITLRFFREREIQGKIFRFESRHPSRRVKEGPLKEDDALEIFLFLVGHVLQHSVPEPDIEQEFATVTTLDLFAVVVFDSHRIQKELKVLHDIGLHDVGKTRGHAAHVGTSSSATAATSSSTASASSPTATVSASTPIVVPIAVTIASSSSISSSVASSSAIVVISASSSALIVV
mmetsp:Transcript_15314/g.38592  ORF Transcript_15314/g.38592 Transcript_15314/m.38592 type:complete len:355 (+) Transcript_15314:3748-4812(+)